MAKRGQQPPVRSASLVNSEVRSGEPVQFWSDSPSHGAEEIVLGREQRGTARLFLSIFA